MNSAGVPQAVIPPRADPAEAGEPGTGFGLYVHWPFCQAKCPYCDFNSHVTASIDQARWARALAAEIRHVARLSEGRLLSTVFFGGGTPSTMESATVAAVMEAVRDSFDCRADLEVSLEANPTSADAARFEGYRDAGVNRLSLGVQALNDRDLQRLGRLHSAAEARAAFGLARDTFPRVSFDLICARQDQTLGQWQSELGEALDLAIDHLSLYQLTIEPGTAFAERRMRGGLRGLPDEDLGAELYEATVAACEAVGLAQYEVSNFARPGQACRHNLIYWSAGDYAGVGPGAHGRLTFNGYRCATTQTATPGRWLHAAEEGHGKHRVSEMITVEDQWVEYVLMGLRKSEGIHLPTLNRIGAASDEFEVRAGELIGLGLLSRGPERLAVTPRGRLLLDSIVSRLVG